MQPRLLRSSNALVAIGSVALLLISVASGCGSSAPTDCASYGTCVGDDASPEAALDGGGTDAPSTGDGNADSASDSPASDAPIDAGVQCDAGIACGGQCVDPTQIAHCGSCTNTCAAPASGHGHATCTMPTCGVACDTGYHACNGNCLADTDDPSMDACVVSEAFGVFVAPTGADASGCGTKASPCLTIAYGMNVAHAANKRTYVCEGTYAEALVVGAQLDGAKVFGGFACGTWTYDAMKKPKVAPAAPGYALVVDSLQTGVLFEDFAFEAKSAASAGDSSVAIFAKNASGGVVLRRVNVTAGDGIGITIVAGTTSNYSGAAAQDGSAPTGAQKGPGGVAVCANGNTSAGGDGGNGGSASNGGAGSWNPAGTTSAGRDGLPGQGGQFSCTTGADPGADGAGGTAGPAANTSGTLDASGWHPAAGSAGGYGKPAQGGGGGGGKTTPATGGGGGGAGGCGGGSGGGGAGGGSSIAVLSFHSAITLDACTVTLGNAGKGGDGGQGQAGQGGGAFNAPATACQGNYGGNGGGGSGGGGGAGGVSVGVLYSMTAPTLTATTIALGSRGAGGAAGGGGAGGTNALGTGTSGASGNAGPPGIAMETLGL